MALFFFAIVPIFRAVLGMGDAFGDPHIPGH